MWHPNLFGIDVEDMDAVERATEALTRELTRSGGRESTPVALVTARAPDLPSSSEDAAATRRWAPVAAEPSSSSTATHTATSQSRRFARPAMVSSGPAAPWPQRSDRSIPAASSTPTSTAASVGRRPEAAALGRAELAG